MYRLIEFRILGAGAARYADEAREMVARILARIPGAESAAKALMYGQEQGVINCRFLSRKNGFAMLGLGPQGQHTVTAAAQLIAIELCRDLKVPVIIEDVKDGDVQIEPLPYKRRYEVRRLVHQKKPRHPQEADAARLQTVIERSLRRQALMLGLDVPQKLQIDVVSWQPSTPVPIAGKAYAASVKNVIFDANASLCGWWGFGYLLSRGYGAMHAQAAAQLQRAEKWEARHEIVA